MEPEISYTNFNSINLANALNILLLNIHSLRNKLNLTEAEIIRLKRPKIVILTENWVEPGTEDYYNINGYTSYHSTRPDGYGGVSVYIDSNLKHSLIATGSIVSDEVQYLRFRIHEGDFDLLAIYRRPNDRNLVNFLTEYDRLVESLRPLITAGDMNIDTNKTTSTSSRYRSILESNSIFLLNGNEPTFPISNGPGSPGSVLDHFSTNITSMRANLAICDSALSEHRCVILSIFGQFSQTIMIERSHFDSLNARNHILEQLEANPLPDMSQIHQILTESVNSYTTITRREVSSKDKTRLPWMTSMLNTEMLYRDWLNMIRRDSVLTPEERSLRDTAYRRQRNKVNSMTRNARRNYINNLIQTAHGDQNKLWGIVRYVLKNDVRTARNDLPSELITTSGVVMNDPDGIAEELNRHFSEISVELKEALIRDNSGRPQSFTLSRSVDSSIYARPTNETEILQILSRLNARSATGVDRVSLNFMKTIGPPFVQALVNATNLCLKTGEFPSTFKDARVTALFKGGIANQPMNYRPLSVIPNPSKLTESVVYTRMWDFALANDLIDPNQYGFMKGSSTTSAILSLIHRCIDSIEKRLLTAVVFIDVKKAFDCVDHELLLKKLHQLGYRGQILELIRQYLFARRQRVQHGRHKSGYRFVRNGVPQGSILSSLLFIIFVNDIFDLPLKGHLQLYADDAALVYSCTDPQTLASYIQHDLDILYNWFYNNLMSFNISKTKYIIIQQTGINVDLPPILVKGSPIERVFSYKYLGLWIDQRLKWTDHVNSVKTKIRPFLAVLRRCATLIPDTMKLSLYYSSIHSHLLHLISIWGTTAANRIDELSRLQNKAIRYIFWRDYHQDNMATIDIYKKYFILRVPELVKYESIMTIFRVKHGLLRTTLDFPLNSEHQVRTSRRQSYFYVPRSRTDYHGNSLAHRGINWYNSLPNEIRRNHDLKSFKRLLKNHFVSEY